MDRNEEKAELPGDIIYTHILPRLPVRSLMRFRCVSKYWNQLTYDPSFARLHKSLHCPTHLLITSWSVVGDESRIHFVSVPVRKDAKLGTPVHLLSLPIDKHYVLQSLNGLLCIHRSNMMYPYHGDKPVFIFNPSTREIATVPVDDTLKTRSSHVSYYFGFCQLTNEHKVLGLRRFFNMDFEPISIECEVYTIGSGSWRRIKPAVPFDPAELTYYTDPVCFNGALHWICQSQKSIVAFDVGGECFREFQMPEGFPSRSFLGYLLIVGGRLAMVNGKHLFDESTMELWVLDDYQKHVWVKDCIKFPFDWTESGRPIPAGTIHNGELLLLPILSVSSMSVLFYDMKRRSFRRVEVSGLPEHFLPISQRITSYEESIMALGGRILGQGVEMGGLCDKI
uniref:F-box protein At5g62510-like n=1 Tax=Rhizophora mucronata TaxID=61149 RepID=A0A2P2K4Y2_RHIMU